MNSRKANRRRICIPTFLGRWCSALRFGGYGILIACRNSFHYLKDQSRATALEAQPSEGSRLSIDAFVLLVRLFVCLV